MIVTINGNYSPNSINWFVFIMGTESILCEVGTEVLYIYIYIYISPCHSSGGYLPASHCGEPSSIPREICAGQSDTGKRFSPGTPVFACQYHSTNAPYSSSSTCCSYRADKRVKPGKLCKEQCSF
jgi:hypothetical protein